MEKTTIFIDLDGTVLDVSERLYRLYVDIFSEFQCKPRYSKYEYWSLKRKMITEDKIVEKELTESLLRRYKIKRKFLIESQKYLSYDVVKEDASDFLNIVSKTHHVVLITKRKNKELLLKQLKKLFLINHFSEILLCSNKQKEECIRKSSFFNICSSIVIGDTEDDIIAGKNLGVPTFAITTGIRNETFLNSLKPTALMSSLLELLNYRKLFKLVS